MAALGVDLTLGSAWATCQDLGRRHAAVVAACMNTIGTLGSAAAVWVTGTIVEAHVANRAVQSGVEIAALDAEVKRLAALDGYAAVFSTYVLVYLAAAACWLLIDSSRPLDAEA
jgi:predicted DNA repair protein MutK